MRFFSCGCVALGGIQRTPFPANVRAMASEGLWGTALVLHSEGCSCELCEAKVAWRWTISMLFSTRRFSGLLTHCEEPRRRCRAGGRRPA
eukprot:4488335-Prymnesium_polylepis.1